MENRSYFSQDNIQEVLNMDDLFNYNPTKLGQKVLIKDCGIWYTTEKEDDGRGGKRMCWVPWIPKRKTGRKFTNRR